MNQEKFSFIEGIALWALGAHTKVKAIQSLAGGCINQAVKISTNTGSYFVKWAQEESSQFEVEAKALAILKSAGSIKVPEVINHGSFWNRSFLVLEYIHPGEPSKDFWGDFGAQLAELHRRNHGVEKYGLDHNNFIGSLEQRNEWESQWIDFFIQKRLEPQISLAYFNGHIGNRFLSNFRQLYDVLPGMLTEEKPALLHGDLWSGNFMVGKGGVPFIIDPALYYGNREIEIAFTQLFGGFSDRFYRTYSEVWPLKDGFSERVNLYNLYPLLVHLNLFGNSYLPGIEKTLRRYV